MTNKEILQKAIEKAVDNGFFIPKNAWNKEIYVSDDLSYITIIWDFYQEINKNDKDYDDLHESNGKFTCEPNCCGTNQDNSYSANDIIFSHEFVKAFWGKCEYWSNENSEDEFPYLGVTQRREDCVTTILCWQYHLQQMVLEKEPIKYLEKFL